MDDVILQSFDRFEYREQVLREASEQLRKSVRQLGIAFLLACLNAGLTFWIKWRLQEQDSDGSGVASGLVILAIGFSVIGFIALIGLVFSAKSVSLFFRCSTIAPMRYCVGFAVFWLMATVINGILAVPCLLGLPLRLL